MSRLRSQRAGAAELYRELGAANIGLRMEIQISVGGIERSTSGSSHQILQQDTSQLDEWKMEVDFLGAVADEATILLRGNTSYLLPGSSGLFGTVTFPPNLVINSTLLVGNYGARDAQGTLIGSLIFTIVPEPTAVGTGLAAFAALASLRSARR